MKKINFVKVFFLINFILGCGLSKFKSESSEAITDPLMKYAWHIENIGQAVFATTPGLAGYDLNLSQTWTGQIFGKGIVIQVSDDGIEDTHEDLVENFSYLNTGSISSKNYTTTAPYNSSVAAPIANDDNHGTCVAGLIASVGFNAIGSRGVAPKAHLTVANLLSTSVTLTNAIKIDQLNGDFDISNMSWGTTQDSIYTLNAAYYSQVQSRIASGRNGKGTLFVKAAGNDFALFCNGSTSVYCIGNSNFDSDNSIPYIISVAALNSQGQSASYSSIGSNLWISSFGGEFGSDTPAMITTDRSGCANGYSVSSESASFEKGASAENSKCNYTSTFNGTSAAAPVLSGVIALILEVNPALTWREVKYILAKSAHVDFFETGVISHPLSVTLPSGYDWEQKWITNSAGFKFHNWYGFGRVNVDQAIQLAQQAKTVPPLGTGAFTETNWDASHANTGLSLPIPDNSSTGVTSTVNVSTNLKIEAVQLRVKITHSDISELALELTSPSGTKSIIVNARNSLTGIADFDDETFLTNAFYQENSVGDWTLKVIDAKTGTTGTLTSFKLNIFGAP